MQKVRLTTGLVAALLGSASLAVASAASAHDLSIDTTAAHAVLEGLSNANLTAAQAHRIAQMPANQAIVRKVASFGVTASEASFARELLAAAHGQTATDEHFYFNSVKARLPDVVRTLNAFEQHRDENMRWILERVARFSPPGPPLHLKGWIIVGGNSTGFALGGPDFYVRISDFVGAPDYLKTIMAHELFHAVRGAALAAAHKEVDFDAEQWRKIRAAPARDAYAVRGILTALLDEGIASYVGDPSQTTTIANGHAVDERNRIHDASRNPKRLANLLDMTLRSVTGDRPLEFDDAYAVGFTADQPLYYLGYGMAKVIAQQEGDARLGEIALGDGCGFANEYLKLIRSDPKLPKLGARTAELIGTYCGEG